MSVTTQRDEIRGYHAVRAAARDYGTYSSELIGDRDTRDYRALPLETDPPAHTRYRAAVQPLFMSSAIGPKAASFQQLADRLLTSMTAAGGNLPDDLALPYVMGCLATIFNRPQDLAEWTSWGPDVWLADAYARGLDIEESRRVTRYRDFAVGSLRSGRTLHDYLERVYRQTRPAAPDADPSTTDVWSWLAGRQIDGAPLSRDEWFGVAHLLLAGGRDTVIKLITGIAWHLIAAPADLAHLRAHPEAHNAFLAEMLRFLTPIGSMERLHPDPDRRALPADDPRRYIRLNFSSANHDPSIFSGPDHIDVHRDRKPHLAFGFGRHSCIGMNITEFEGHAFLRAFLAHPTIWRFAEEPDITWEIDDRDGTTIRVLESFRRVPVVAVSTSRA